MILNNQKSYMINIIHLLKVNQCIHQILIINPQVQLHMVHLVLFNRHFNLLHNEVLVDQDQSDNHQ